MEEIWGLRSFAKAGNLRKKLRSSPERGFQPCPGLDLHPRSVPQPLKAEMELTESMMAAMVRACKHRDITVTSAVEAAFLLANIEFADPSLKDRPSYLPIHACDMRPYPPEPYTTSSFYAI